MSQIDARGPRFGAAITAVVFAVSLITGPGVVGTTLVALQLIVFSIGAFVGLQASPYGRIYRRVVQPRLAGPVPLEDQAPPRFAQLVGVVFSTLALVGALIGSSTLFSIAAAIVLAASFLNAVFAFCLGCEVFLLAKRLRA